MMNEYEKNLIARSLKSLDNHHLNSLGKELQENLRTGEIKQESYDEFMNIFNEEANLRTEKDDISPIGRRIKKIEDILVEAHKRINSNKLEAP